MSSSASSRVIAAYKEDGRWADAYQKWIGQYTDEEQDPPDLTLEEAIEQAP